MFPKFLPKIHGYSYTLVKREMILSKVSTKQKVTEDLQKPVREHVFSNFLTKNY